MDIDKILGRLKAIHNKPKEMVDEYVESEPNLKKIKDAGMLYDIEPSGLGSSIRAIKGVTEVAKSAQPLAQKATSFFDDYKAAARAGDLTKAKTISGSMEEGVASLQPAYVKNEESLRNLLSRIKQPTKLPPKPTLQSSGEYMSGLPASLEELSSLKNATELSNLQRKIKLENLIKRLKK